MDHDRAGFARLVLDGDGLAVARPQLVEQWQGIVVVHESHRLAGNECIERTEAAPFRVFKCSMSNSTVIRFESYGLQPPSRRAVSRNIN